jgi:hypothetical protein
MMMSFMGLRKSECESKGNPEECPEQTEDGSHIHQVKHLPDGEPDHDDTEPEPDHGVHRRQTVLFASSAVVRK